MSESKCRFCGKVIARLNPARRKFYCSSRCQSRAYRARAAKAKQGS